MAIGYGQQPYGTSQYGGSITAADLPYGTLPSSSAVVGFATVGASVVDQDLGSVTMGRQDVTIRGVGRTIASVGVVAGQARATVPTVTTTSAATGAQPSGLYPVVHYNTQLFQAGDVGIVPGLNRLTALSQVTFDPGSYEFLDFAQGGGVYGIFHQFLAGIFGLTANPADTEFHMRVNTSTKTSPSTGTNNLCLIRVGTSANPPTFGGNFTLNGTSQAATTAYSGLLLYRAGPGSKWQNFVCRGAPGSANLPPNETFQISLLNCNGTSGNRIVLQDVEGSGLNAAGQLVGASPFGHNTTSWVDVINAYFHDTRASNPTWWQATDSTTTNMTSQRCGTGTGSSSAVGINHEESTRVTHFQPKIYVTNTANLSYPHLQVASQNFDCTVDVRDATWDHPAWIGSNQMACMIPTNYGAGEVVTGTFVTQHDAAGNLLTLKFYH